MQHNVKRITALPCPFGNPCAPLACCLPGLPASLPPPITAVSPLSSHLVTLLTREPALKLLPKDSFWPCRWGRGASGLGRWQVGIVAEGRVQWLSKCSWLSSGNRGNSLVPCFSGVPQGTAQTL